MFHQQMGILHMFMGLLPCETVATYAEIIEFFKYLFEKGQYILSKMEFELCWCGEMCHFHLQSSSWRQ